MNDDILIIQEDPLVAGAAFDVVRSDVVILLKDILNFISQRLDLSGRITACENEIISTCLLSC